MEHFLNYITWNPDPILFHLGPLAIRWYAICWIIGLALGYVYMQKLYKEQGIPDEKFEPLFLYPFIAILVGARLGHCLFYEPEVWLQNAKTMFEIVVPIHIFDDGSWKFTGYQGLASHGGVIGLLISIALYCRKYKVNGWVLLDNMGIISGITACFIRLGNLMNSEIIGKVTDVPWAFIFLRDDALPRHPGQLYEAIAYICIFAFIYSIYKKKGPQSVGNGLYFGLCLTLIFTFRFFVEYAKEIQVASEANLPIDMGQILSIPFILIGLASIWHAYSVSKKEINK